MRLAFIKQKLYRILFKILYMNKTHKHFPVFYIGEMFSLVYTRRLNAGAGALEFMEIQFGIVKASKVVDHCYHKFHRKICFQEQALVTLYRKTCRVCF